ncbi:hypothetical protein MFLAVUS_009726 [Mucor flavus]|uniref:Uncharacterized protein n=1 Tax=Mucor flavus TaxID=439312 RepID=A0ABP9ZAP9_9FUNG
MSETSLRNLFRFVSSLFRQNEKQNTVYEPPCTAEDSDTSFESEEEVFYSCLDDDTAATYYDASDPDTSDHEPSKCESLLSLERDSSDNSSSGYDATEDDL